MKKLLLPVLLFAFTAVVSLRAADALSPSPQIQTIANVRTAKIIAIDKVKRTLTLLIKGKTYVLSLNQNVLNKRTGKNLAWNQLAVGGFIHFVTQPQPNGQLEIVSLMVLSGQSESVPEGEGASLGDRTGGGSVDVSPFN